MNIYLTFFKEIKKICPLLNNFKKNIFSILLYICILFYSVIVIGTKKKGQKQDRIWRHDTLFPT